MTIPKNSVDVLIAFNSDDDLTRVMAAQAIETLWPKKADFLSALHKANYTATEFGKSLLKEPQPEAHPIEGEALAARLRSAKLCIEEYVLGTNDHGLSNAIGLIDHVRKALEKGGV